MAVSPELVTFGAAGINISIKLRLFLQCSRETLATVRGYKINKCEMIFVHEA